MRIALVPLFAFTLLTATRSAAQESGSNCGVYMRPIFYSAEKGAHFSESLEDYFKKTLPAKNESQRDSFRVQLIIDSVGGLDCTTIKYNTTTYTSEEITRAIDSMPKWLPATQNGHPVTFCVIIVVGYENGKQTINYLNEYPRRPTSH